MLKDIFDRKLNEECGVFGVFNLKEATMLTYYGIHSLQHRGQEGAGIAAVIDGKIKVEKGEGLVTEVFSPESLTKIESKMAIGHVRYSTAGGGGIENVQPIFVRCHQGDFAIVHNGNIVNANELKIELESEGSIFSTTSDTEILGHLIQKEKGSFEERIKKALLRLEGAFSFMILTKDTLYVMRDKNGFRPLSLGKLGEGYIVSSETSAFDNIGAEYIRDIKPGEILKISKNGLEESNYTEKVNNRMCAMEYIYFSRPDSQVEGLNVHQCRKKCGEILAREALVDADIVIGVPDSSLSSAMGFAEYSKIPYEMGLIKNRYIGRTFIKPSQEQRERGVKMKLSVLKSVISNKRVILVDDSIVRGTTSKYIVKLLKDAGAKEVHMRIASPPIISPCFYGVDTSTYNELISAKLTVEEVRKEIGATSLAFLSMDGLEEAIGKKLCTACFTGKYPTEIFSMDKMIKNRRK